MGLVICILSPNMYSRHTALHPGMDISRFAYTTLSFRLHSLSRFAYIKVVSPTLIRWKYFVKIDENHCL